MSAPQRCGCPDKLVIRAWVEEYSFDDNVATVPAVADDFNFHQIVLLARNLYVYYNIAIRSGTERKASTRIYTRKPIEVAICNLPPKSRWN